MLWKGHFVIRQNKWGRNGFMKVPSVVGLACWFPWKSNDEVYIKVGTYDGTSPCDYSLQQVAGTSRIVWTGHFAQNLVAVTKIWSMRLVPRIQIPTNSVHTMWLVPATSPCNKSQEQVAGTSRRNKSHHMNWQLVLRLVAGNSHRD